MGRKLNILNGELLKKYFVENSICVGEDIISFNECLVDGELYKDIFSKEFFDIRERFITRRLGVTAEQYREKSIKEIAPLLQNNYQAIRLWFDFDMYCQINMLVVLAYFDYVRYEGAITINIVKQDFFHYNNPGDIVEDKIELKSHKGFYNLYTDLMINKEFQRIDKYFEIFSELPYLKEGVRLYINYNLPGNEITKFIEERKHKGRKEILFDLIKELNNYGLSDTQYKSILDGMNIL